MTQGEDNTSRFQVSLRSLFIAQAAIAFALVFGEVLFALVIVPIVIVVGLVCVVFGYLGPALLVLSPVFAIGAAIGWLVNKLVLFLSRTHDGKIGDKSK